jgi:hypothetical protein
MRTYDLLNLYGKRRSDQNSPARAVAWNKWMTEDPDERIDLSEADLRGAYAYW